MANTREFANYPLWIADYRGNAQPEVPGGWSHWTFWQYTDRGTIPGIPGPTDINHYSGSHADLDRLSNSGMLSFGSFRELVRVRQLRLAATPPRASAARSRTPGAPPEKHPRRRGIRRSRDSRRGR